RGVDVDDSGVDCYLALAFVGAQTAKGATEPAGEWDVAAGYATDAADVHTLILKTKLGDCTDDDCIDTQQFTDFAGRGRVCSVADREVLLFHDRVKHLAIDDRICAVSYEICDNQADNALAHVVGAYFRGNCSVLERHDGNAPFGAGIGHLG